MSVRIGFIGLGLMGAPMVRRLLARGHPVTAWNLEPERAAEVPGAAIAADPATVREASDIVISCVLDAHAVDAVCFGPRGLAAAHDGAALLIDCSTINPDQTRAFAARLQPHGMSWVDAPISGGPALADCGGLTILVGGTEADVALAAPVLDDLAANRTHLGALGAGQTAKILNQAIVGVSYVLMAEALALARAAGLDAARLPEALAGGLADSQALQRIYRQMEARAWDQPTGYARQLDKDLKNVAGFAADLGLALPLLQAAIDRYHGWAANHPTDDSTAIARAYD